MVNKGDKKNSEEEVAPKIVIFRDRIKDLEECRDYDDYTLENWLKARSYDVEKAITMLRDSVAYKKKMDVDNLLDSYTLPKVLKEYFASGFCGFDKDGSPVLVESYGYMDMRGLMLSCKKEDMEKGELLKCEEIVQKCEMMSKKLNKRVEGLTVIFDMDRVGPKSLWRPGLQMYLHLARILQLNYPNMLKRIFVVNVPKIFPFLWKICRPLISDELKNTLHVLGSNFKTNLLEYIDADNLPEYLGGEKRDPDGNGRCISLICQGGIVPNSYYLTELADENNLQIKTVPNREVFKLDFCITVVGAILKWEFMTEDHDILFGIVRIKENQEEEEVLSKQKYACQHMIQEGHYVCQHPGNYQVHFDNTFSLKTPKKVFYSVEMHAKDSEAGELDDIAATGSWITLSKDLENLTV